MRSVAKNTASSARRKSFDEGALAQRLALVESLKRRIAEGGYAPGSAETADSLLKNASARRLLGLARLEGRD